MAFQTSFSDITGALGDIFGGSSSTSGAGKSKTTVRSSATRSEKLNLDVAAIQQIISDVLGGAGGLAEIFGGEQQSGVFNSSVAAQASGDLAAKLVGELAKLTAEKETTEKGVQQTKSKGSQSGGTESGGLLGAIGGLF